MRERLMVTRLAWITRQPWMSRPSTTIPAVATTMSPAGPRVTPLGTPVLVASGKAGLALPVGDGLGLPSPGRRAPVVVGAASAGGGPAAPDPPVTTASAMTRASRE